MLHNIYSYIFVASLIWGAVFANLIRLLRKPGRRERWDALSNKFLLQIILAIITVFAGLLISDVKSSSLISIFYFWSGFTILFTFLFLIIEIFTLVLSGLILFGLSLFLQINLSEYIPVKNKVTFNFLVVQNKAEEYVIEVRGIDSDPEYYGGNKEGAIPVIEQLHFSPILFCLPSNVYVRFIQIAQDTDSLNTLPYDSIRIPPFLFSRNVISGNPMPKELLEGYSYIFNRNGSVDVKK
ncbi:MAG: hypothetical protein JXR86_14645 [Spirochaetales bacterium]|nr:hypothetical protein [Spirochaetales bacterium]